MADCGGHAIPGAFALYLHIDQRYKLQAEKPTTFCQIFGACMVFFGLCPLLFGCAMAVERCVAITKPFFHASVITVRHVRRVVSFLATLALVLAALPLFKVGTYTAQIPGTWCFLLIHGPQSTADIALALAFSCLGLTALILSLLCNILSGAVLLQARINPHNANAKSTTRCNRRPSSASTSSMFWSLDVEMMVQLVAITVVSCVCWSPFLVSTIFRCFWSHQTISIEVYYCKILPKPYHRQCLCVLCLFYIQIHILMVQLNQRPRASSAPQDGFILLGLRMASWNQILDPWVYILLRRAVVSRVFCTFHAQRPTVTADRQTISLQ